MLSKIRYALHTLFRWKIAERELDVEIRFHLEMQVEANIAAGMSPEEARYAALRAFGGVDQAKEQCRDARPLFILGTGLRDFVYAVRSLKSSPAFSLSVVATIALAIGAGSIVFSLTNAVLLRPLPYPYPDRLVHVLGDMPSSNNRDMPLSPSHLHDLESGTKDMFESLTGITADVADKGLLRREDGTPEQVLFANVKPNFFRVMGAKISAGRDFEDSDALPEQSAPTDRPSSTQSEQRLPTMAILSYEFWQRRYGGDPSILGHSMGTGSGVVIAGVLAPHFELFFPPALDTSRAPDLWLAPRDGQGFRVIGRLKRGITLAQAQSRVDAIAEAIQREAPSIEGTPHFRLRLESMQQYLSEQVRPALIALMSAGLFLLFIAASNVASLFLVRAQSRKRQIAVRAALGARWMHLVGPIVAEATVLSGTATLLGLAMASVGARTILALAPPGLPRIDKMSIGLPEFAFAGLIGFVIAATPGILWAGRVLRIDLREALAGGTRVGHSRRSRLLNNSLVVTQVVFAFALLVACGLMTRSFIAMKRINPGYDPNHLLTFVLAGRYLPDPQQRRALTMEIRRRLSAIPGIASVALAGQLPLADTYWPADWGNEDSLTDLSKVHTADVQVVSPGYFETLRLRILAGRPFTDEDNAPDQHTVIVDQLFAEKAFPKGSAIGERILIGHFRAAGVKPEWVEIIGVVDHERARSLSEPGREQIFFSDCFLDCGSRGRWVLRTTGDPSDYGPAIRKELTAIDSRFAPLELQPMTAFVERAQASLRFEFMLVGLFAISAAFLAGIGIYGVLSTVVRERTTEIGIRVALGARPQKVFGMVITQGLQLGLAGIFIGYFVALALGRLLSNLLFGVKASDPATVLFVAALSIGITFLASYVPARRAARVDPMIALRSE